jgi:FkbM family methyltransferase
MLFHASNFRARRSTAKAREYRLRLREEEHRVSLRTSGGDFFVFHEVFLDRCYALSFLKPSQVETVVDLGAHIGLTTLFYYAQFPQARFVCVEPNPHNVELLRKNLRALGSRAQVVAGAVSGRTGLLTFDFSGRSWEGKLVSQPSGAGVRVRGYTVEEILRGHALPTISILKVDVEGAEASMFEAPAGWTTFRVSSSNYMKDTRSQDSSEMSSPTAFKSWIQENTKPRWSLQPGCPRSRRLDSTRFNGAVKD